MTKALTACRSRTYLPTCTHTHIHICPILHTHTHIYIYIHIHLSIAKQYSTCRYKIFLCFKTFQQPWCHLLRPIPRPSWLATAACCPKCLSLAAAAWECRIPRPVLRPWPTNAGWCPPGMGAEGKEHEKLRRNAWQMLVITCFNWEQWLISMISFWKKPGIPD